MSPVRFGTPLYVYDRVTSTQDVAREWLERGAMPGTVVTARQMTTARGRLGRVWEHPPGANIGLTALAPALPAAHAWQVALVAGLAACQAVRQVAPTANAQVRFPNDVYASGRKLAGILVETIPQSGNRVVPLVGIGINVARAEHSPDIAIRAVSLEEAASVAVPLASVQSALFERLTACWEQWQAEGFAALLPAWHALLDRAAFRTFVFKGEDYPCRVIGLAEDGTLSLESESGMKLSASAALVLVES